MKNKKVKLTLITLLAMTLVISLFSFTTTLNAQAYSAEAFAKQGLREL